MMVSDSRRFFEGMKTCWMYRAPFSSEGNWNLTENRSGAEAQVGTSGCRYPCHLLIRRGVIHRCWILVHFVCVVGLGHFETVCYHPSWEGKKVDHPTNSFQRCYEVNI